MGWTKRIANLWRRERVDAEIDAELQAHLDMAAEDEMSGGMSEEAARRAARLRFGNPVSVREQTAAEDAVVIVEAALRDLRHTMRQLRRSPAFTITAVMTLALGIGATTAIFTLIQQVWLRSLPVVKPEQLWRIGDSNQCCYSARYNQGDWNFFSWEAYNLFRAHTPAFEDLAAFQVGEGNAELGVRGAGAQGAAEARNGEYVSGNFFRTLGVAAWRGRLFTDDDDREGAAPVAVMSFHTWRERYGADPSVVGATWQINGHPFTVVGVAPPGFYGATLNVGTLPDLWLPLATEPMIAGESTRLRDARVGWLDLIGRVHPGGNHKALEAQLQAELHAWLASHLADMSPQEQSQWQKQVLRLTPGGAGVSTLRDDYRSSLRLLLAASLCLLLVACANLANLLLARGLRHRPQAALCAALGASRARLVRKALTESLTLSLLGAVAGMALAYGGARLMLHLAFGAETWLPLNAAPSFPMLLFALAVSVTTAIVFGTGPAWLTSRADPIEAMRGANRSMVGGGRGSRRSLFGTAAAQRSLVAAQAAVSLVLLSSAALLGQSLRNLERQNFGFQPEGRYLVSIDPKLSSYRQDQLAPLFRALEERLRAIPGVREAGSALHAPLTGSWDHEIRIEGRPEPGVNDELSANWTRVTPGFFRTYDDRILMGRSITEGDDAAARPVAVVNEAFARRFFGRENPVGRHFGPAPMKNAAMYEIVGVAADLCYQTASAGDPEQPMYFLPEAQSTQFDEASSESREVWSHYLYNIALWAPGYSGNMEAQVRGALAAIDPDLLMYNVRSYPDVIRDSFAREKMIVTLTWLFGAAGLLLAAVGLYGVTAYGVEQRTGEIGVRLALGANRTRVVLMVLGDAFRPIAFGLAVGIPAAVGTGTLMASQLFGVAPWNPVMLTGAVLLLALAALPAAWFPARRAAGVDPMQALRSE